MNFQVKILLLSFVISIVFSIIIIPILRRLKVGQIERTDGPESHLKKQGTPTMGGVIIAITLIITSLVLYFYEYRQSEPEVASKIIPLVFVSLGFGFVGFKIGRAHV